MKTNRFSPAPFISRLLMLIVTPLLLSACGEGVERSFPVSNERERQAERGKLSGETGLVLFGGDESEKGAASGGGGIGVNGYLWRATLDTLSFLPLKSVDPFGGVIITDWYEDPETPGERFKADVLILDSSLRADGVKVTLFKQMLENGTWRDTAVDSQLARQLEDTILTRARQLRIKQKH